MYVAATGSPPRIAIGNGACRHKHAGAKDDADADVREVEPACEVHMITVMPWLSAAIDILVRHGPEAALQRRQSCPGEFSSPLRRCI